MQPLLDNPALKLYALVGALIAVHLVLLAFWTGTVRAKHKTWVNPEDAALNKGTQAESDHPDTLRAKRAHQNAMESAIPFFAVGLLYALTAPSQLGAQAYFFTFLGARVLHSIFYLAGKQPFRTIMFAIGSLAILGMAVHVIRVVV
jgi:glutathione S-transferase